MKRNAKSDLKRQLEKILFENKKTLLDYHRSINRAAFEGFEEGFRKVNEMLTEDEL